MLLISLTGSFIFTTQSVLDKEDILVWRLGCTDPAASALTLQGYSTILSIVCPRSIYPNYMVTYYIKWVTTSLTHSMIRHCTLILTCQLHREEILVQRFKANTHNSRMNTTDYKWIPFFVPHLLHNHGFSHVGGCFKANVKLSANIQ